MHLRHQYPQAIAETLGGIYRPSSINMSLQGEDLPMKTEELVEEMTEDTRLVKGENEVMRLLEDLCLEKPEPELLNEQLKSNDQLQQDEILALKSIYGENAFIVEKHNGLRSVQINIHIEKPNEVTVTAKLSSSVKRVDGEGSNEILYSFEVQYLPPIVLTMLLPKSYPSHLPPHFSVSAMWLDTIKISKLCSMLDTIWTEQPGKEVMYRWVEWLQNSSLSCFGFDKEIILGPYGVLYEGDRRAVSGSLSIDVDVPTIRRYNEEKCRENFCNTSHECYICFSEYPGSDFIKLSCGHFFCRKCMKIYASINVAEHTISKLRCPDTKCKGMLPPGLVKELIGHEEYERCESIMLQKALDSMSDAVYCPRCQTICAEEDEKTAQCPKCYFGFCTVCYAQQHAAKKCMPSELKLQVLQQRQDLPSLSAKQKHMELNMINELLNLKEILRDAKQCPHCKMAISRTEGCNQMTCKQCGKYFCYRCGKAINGHDHFGEKSCQLFPSEHIRRWERQMNALPGNNPQRGQQNNAPPHLMPPRGRLAWKNNAGYFGQRNHWQAQRTQENIEASGGLGLKCPNCRHFNAKVGNNNHLLCLSCQTTYCYLCKQQVLRCSKHYGPKHKQHTQG